MSLEKSSSVLLNFLRGSHSNRNWLSNMSYCGVLSKIYIKLPSFSLSTFRKGEVLVLNDSKSEEGWKKNLETLIWGIVARYWKKLKEFRIQSSVWVDNENSKTMNKTRIWYPQSVLWFSNDFPYFFYTITLISIRDSQRLIHLWNKSSYIKLGLIIYISSARIVMTI